MIATAAKAAARPSRVAKVYDLGLDHLSWSSLSTYQSCPKKFAFRYLEKAPSERVSAALPFGAAFHTAAEACHQAQMEGRTLPQIKQLLDVFKAEWSDRVKESPEIVFGKNDDPETLQELAGRMLAAYREHLNQKTQSPAILGIEQRHQFQILPDVPPILMIADLIELDGETLIVSDLKTSASRWSEAKTQESLPQVILYGHGLMPMLRATGAKKLAARFVVVTKAKAPAVQVLQPKPTKSDVDRLKEQVADIWKAIKAGGYYRIEGWACKSCSYRRRCLGR